MEIKCTCPYCSKAFVIDLDDALKPRQKRNLSPEVRQRKAELMRQRRAAGWGGNRKGG